METLPEEQLGYSVAGCTELKLRYQLEGVLYSSILEQPVAGVL
jgi:hypothetical protein